MSREQKNADRDNETNRILREEYEQQLGSAATSLAEFYGARFVNLPTSAQQALTLDVVDIMDENDDAPMSGRLAVQTLDRRIGNLLESYAAVLISGQERAE